MLACPIAFGGILSTIGVDLLPIELFRSSRKEHIAATIKRRLYGVLDDTEDETYIDLLHSLGVDDADIRFDNFGG